MYWYTPKDLVDFAFEKAKLNIATDLNILEFHKIIAPLIALSREDHTDVFLPKDIKEAINTTDNIKFLPLKVVFLNDKLYCVSNASGDSNQFESLEIEKINGESPLEIVKKIGSLFASDGFIKSVKFSDLSGLNFSKYYYYYYGIIEKFEIKFKNLDTIISLDAISMQEIRKNLNKNDGLIVQNIDKNPLKLNILNSKTAYLDIQTFSNSDIRKVSNFKSFKKFLKSSFREINEKNIENIIIDISKNGGGSEGNEGLLYSYFGENYQKYIKVRAKKQKIIIRNNIDKPIKLKVFGFLERIFANKKMSDGSLERTNNCGIGLMAFKKEPENKFKRKIYIITSPITYSGASEFANMMATQGLATFIGEETGGGYYGNTSGYTRKLTLPNSKISIDIPTLQFVMNVKPIFPFGSGVKPNFKVIPTINQFINNENVCLEYALKLINANAKN